MRLIDADELMRNNLCGVCGCTYWDPVFCPDCKYYEVRFIIEAAPTIEFEPGQWIDKNALIDELDIMISNAILSDTAIHYALVRERVLQQKAIDTMSHAKWVSCDRDSAYNSYIKCSHCNHEVVMYADSIKTPPKYCEECGFRMDGGADNDDE